MSDHAQDIFLWRWAQDRRAGQIAYALQGSILCGCAAALLSWGAATDAHEALRPQAWASTFLVLTLFNLLGAPVLRLASDLSGSRYMRGALNDLVVAIFIGIVFLSPLGVQMLASGLPAPLSIAAYTLIGVAGGAVIWLQFYRGNEARFQTLLRENCTIPARRPWPSVANLKGAGIWRCFCCAWPRHFWSASSFHSVSA